jgi:hypothetical protein
MGIRRIGTANSAPPTDRNTAASDHCHCAERGFCGDLVASIFQQGDAMNWDRIEATEQRIQ